MKRIRSILAGIVAALLAAGYLASQYAYFNGTAPEYAAKVDQAPIILLSLLIFLGAIALMFVPDSKGPED